MDKDEDCNLYVFLSHSHQSHVCFFFFFLKIFLGLFEAFIDRHRSQGERGEKMVGMDMWQMNFNARDCVTFI